MISSAQPGEYSRAAYAKALLILFRSTPLESTDCAGYGTREWRARLWNIPSGYDWTKACQESPIIINGVHFEM